MRASTRAWLWLSPLLVVCLVAGGAALAVGPFKPLLVPLFSTSSETRNTQVIESITRQQQVVLLSLGIHGLESEKDSKKVTWMDIPVPGSQRVTYVEYSFDAKLGIEGQDVTIEKTGDNAFLITVPRFIFIGHNNENFKLATESNGVLSWMTPEIDELEMATRILNDDTEREYVDKNTDILQDQAKLFYGTIIGGIDPTIVVTFAFDH